MKSYRGLSLKYIKNRKRTTKIILIPLILTVAMVVNIYMTFECQMKQKLELIKKQEGNYDLRLYDIDNNKLKKLNQMEYIDEYSIGKSYGVTVFEGENSYSKIEIYGIDNKTYNDMLNFEIIEGKLPSNEREVLISKNVAKTLINNNVSGRIGSEVKLNVGVNRTREDYYWYDYNNRNKESKVLNEKDIDERLGSTLIKKEQVYKIVGVIDIAEDNDIWKDRLITILPDSIDKSGGIEAFVKTSEKNIEERLSNELGIKYIERWPYTPTAHLDIQGLPNSQIKYPNYIEEGYKPDILGMNLNPAFMIILIVFSAAIIFNGFNSTIAERIKYFGTLKSIGASSKQIFTILLYESIFVLGIALPIGSLIGYIFFQLQVFIITKIMNITFAFATTSISFRAILAAFLITLFILLLTIYMAVRKSNKYSPIEAIRGVVYDNSDGVYVTPIGVMLDKDAILAENIKYDSKTKLFKIIVKFFNIEGELAYKNLNRDTGRYKSNIFSLVFSIVLMLCFIFQFINGKIVENYTRPSANWEYKIESLVKEIDDEYINNINKAPGVENIYYDNLIPLKGNIPVDMINDKLVSIKSGVINKENNSVELKFRTRVVKGESIKLINKYLIEGNPTKEELDNGGVIIVEGWTNWRQVKVGLDLVNEYTDIKPVLKYRTGDYINVEGSLGQRKLKIVGIVSKDILMDNINMNDPLMLTEDMTIIISDNVANSLSDINYNTILLNTNESFNINNINSKYLNKFEYNYKSIFEEEQKVREINLKSSIWNIIFAVAMLVMAIVNLINSIIANIITRKKELASLGTIGMDEEQKERMIKCESLIVGLNAGMVGLAIGGALVAISQSQNLGQGNTSLIGLILLLLTTIFIIIISTVIFSKVPLKELRKIPLVEAMKSE